MFNAHQDFLLQDSPGFYLPPVTCHLPPVNIILCYESNKPSNKQLDGKTKKFKLKKEVWINYKFILAFGLIAS